MGDVIGVVNEDGQQIVSYAYNAWGKVVSKNVLVGGADVDYYFARYNPMLYRSYYYDDTLSMYYLQSRYYMPNICRFMNADIPDIAQQSKDDVNGLNLFAYCNNNPVNGYDPSGYYNANKAYAYAKKWWNKTNIRYGRNGSSDCANFVSQCLYEGDLAKMSGALRYGWHNYMSVIRNQYGKLIRVYDRSWAWAGAENLYEWLLNNNHISQTYILNNASDVNTYGKKFRNAKRCSAVLFIDKYGKQKGHKRHMNHAMILGEILNWYGTYYIYYYAHTSDRYGECYMSDGSYSTAYLQRIFQDKNYKDAKIYICFIK